MLRLVSANLNYSSWSMRPWLALEHAGAEYKLHDVGMKTREGWKERMLSFSGAGKVPVLIDGSLSVHEALAICEYVNELFPRAQLWPESAALRARGRAISCEMASSFATLRARMPTNVRGRAAYAPVFDPDLAADVARVLDIWSASLESANGPFLLGDFSIADCMYFPVATRFRTYGVPLPEFAQAYCDRLFALPAAQRLQELVLLEPPIAEYDAVLADGSLTQV